MTPATWVVDAANRESDTHLDAYFGPRPRSRFVPALADSANLRLLPGS